jgi:DNA-binding HxlR family transcriptional regulator
MTVSVNDEATAVDGAEERAACCTFYHQAVELVGKRWTGAILSVLMDGPLRFSEVKVLVPDLSDRLLSERLKELEAEGIVERKVSQDLPARVDYALTEKGRALQPAVRALKDWAQDWLAKP